MKRFMNWMTEVHPCPEHGLEYKVVTTVGWGGCVDVYCGKCGKGM